MLASAAHRHFVCKQCGSMTEIPGQIFTGLAAAALAIYGFTIEPHRFTVVGICADCLPAEDRGS